MPGLIKWLKKDDTEQHTWAYKYLCSKGLKLYPNPSNYYEALVNFDKQNQTDPVYKLALNSLKSAWRQKNLREKRKGKTEFSIVISNEKKKKLKKTANY